MPRPSLIAEAIPLRLRTLQAQHYRPRTLQGQAGHLRLFTTWCAERELTRLQELTPAVLEAFQRWLSYAPIRTQAPRQVRTQHAILCSVKTFCRWAFRQGYLLLDPSALVLLPRLPQTLPQAVLTVSELEQLMRQPEVSSLVGLRDRALLEVLYATALRCAEVLQLTLADIERARQVLWVRQGKGGKDRLLPLSPRALHWIDRYLRQARPQLLTSSPTETLFLSEQGQALSAKTARTRIARYIACVNPQKPGSLHLIRHSVATALLENGCDTRFIQELLGHASLQSTQIYTHVAISGLKEAYLKTHPSLQPPPPMEQP